MYFILVDCICSTDIYFKKSTGTELTVLHKKLPVLLNILNKFDKFNQTKAEKLEYFENDVLLTSLQSGQS